MGKVSIALLVVFLIALDYFLPSCFLSRVQIFAYLGTFLMGIFALKTYSQNSSIKRMEFIDQLYKQFLEDKDIRDLYDLLNEHKNLKISIKSQNETALIKALTLFDKICNDYEQEIINKKALSYIAAEILDFYTHAGVQGYIKDIYKEYEYDKKKYKEEIRFYSGFIKLGKICEKEYVANNGKKQFGF